MWSIIKRSLWAVLGLAVTTGISYYFYSLSIDRRDPVFIVNPNRIQIVDANRAKSNSVRILRSDGAFIDRDINSVIFYFWNNGRKSIRKSNILSPLIVEFSDDSIEILESRILGVSREDIVRPTLVPIGESKSQLVLQFNILDTNDGIAVQLIYAGSIDAELSLKGSIEEVASVSRLDTFSTRLLSIGFLEWLKSVGAIIILTIGAIIFILIIAGLATSLKRKFNWPSNKNEDKFLIGFWIMTLAVLIGISVKSMLDYRSKYDEIVPSTLLKPISRNLNEAQ
jgi:hypothetical protein